jgi:hypothetical protein
MWAEGLNYVYLMAIELFKNICIIYFIFNKEQILLTYK